MPTVESTLYFAHWCGHCKVFEPQWDEFASQVESNNGTLNGIKVVTKKYEEGSSPDQNPTINGKQIRGYPTVKIKVVGDDGKATEYEYTGKRTKQALIDHISNQSLNNLKKN